MAPSRGRLLPARTNAIVIEPEELDDSLDGYESSMSRLVRRSKVVLGVLVTLALVLPMGAGLIDWFLFDRAGDEVVDELTAADLGATLVDAVVLVQAVRCNGGAVSGTGFATDVGGELVVVTNRHVVDGAALVGLRGLDGRPGPTVARWSTASEADVALLHLDDPEAMSTTIALATTAASVGDPVRTVGFPSAMPFTTAGAVAQAGGRLVLDVEVSGGASGSPVLGGAGTVVGQIYARDDAGRGVATGLAPLRLALAAARPVEPAC